MGKQSRKRRVAAAATALDQLPPDRPVRALRQRLTMDSTAYWGAWGGVAMGGALLGLGLLSLFRGSSLPLPLTIALTVAGGLQGLLSFFTLQRRRAAWSFALSLSGTAALAFLFTAPKIRDTMHVSIAVALIPCAVGTLLTLLLAMSPLDSSS